MSLRCSAGTYPLLFFFFFQAEDGIRDVAVTGVQTCALPISRARSYVRPPLRLLEGRRLAAEAHALTDISDGLAVEAAHVADRSACRIEIELEDRKSVV